MRGMMHRGACLALLWLSGCTATAPGESHTVTQTHSPVPLFQPGLSFAFSEPLLENGVTSNHYNFATVRELWVRVGVQKVRDISMAKVIFTNPKGEKIYETTSPYSADPSVETMAMANMDHPITVRRAKQLVGGFGLDRLVPVAGTVFTRYPMAGPWVVTAQVDGQQFSAEIQVSVTP
jgi:hypothetical protein